MPPEPVRQFHLEAWCYYRNRAELPPPLAEEFGNVYRMQSARALKLSCAVQQVEALLERHGVSYCWIKGADLGLRIYPEPGLRLLGDLDLWLRPEDCDRGRRLLAEDGWHTDYEIRNPHHYSMRHKRGVALEPHFSLPGFEGIDPAELWRAGVRRTPGRSGGVLTPEMNLLLLMQHASNGQWRWCPLVKLLLDTRLLCNRETVDLGLLQHLAERWRIYPAALLFAAFPELFPELPSGNFSAKTCENFRMLFQFEWHGEEHEISMADARRFSMKWWNMRRLGFTPEAIRAKYHLPPGNCTGLPRAYFCDCARKTINFFRFFHSRDSFLKDHLRRIEQIQNDVIH